MYVCGVMFAFLIFFGFLILAAIFIVVCLIMLVVAAIKYKRGSLTQADLDKATKEWHADRNKRLRWLDFLLEIIPTWTLYDFLNRNRKK